MLDIYKSITGSSIDVKITDDVRRVFDRMLGAENLRIDIDNMLMQMKYDPKRWTLDGAGNIVERPTFEINVDKAGAARQADAALATMEGLQERAAALRERINAGSVPKGPDAEVLAAQVVKVRDEYSGRGGYGGTRWSDTKPVSNSQLQGLKDWTLQEMKNAKGGSQNGGDVGQLFQQSEVPFGKYAEDSGFVASGDGLDALWREKVNPLLKAMEAGAMEQVDGLMVDGGRDMSPEGQAMLRKYMQQVKGDMATTKLATVRYAEKQRDFALLNYNKRYGFDRYADFVMPYQFYTSRSMAKLIPLMMDKPAILANYARLRNQANRYERDIPERMRGKFKSLRHGCLIGRAIVYGSTRCGICFSLKTLCEILRGSNRRKRTR